MVGIYVFYVDVFFLQNLMMNLAILLLLNEMEGRSLRRVWKKMFLLSAMFTILEILLLLWLKHYFLFSLCSFFLLLPLMLFFFFGKSTVILFVKRYILAIFEAFLLGGAVTGIANFTGQNSSLIWLLGGGGILCYGITKIVFERRQKTRYFYSVGLFWKGKEVWVQGFYDSGNHLTTGEKRKPVHIVDGKILKSLGITEDTPFSYQSFCALGKKQGMIKIYQIDKMIVQMGKPIEYEGAFLGAEEEGILEQKEYQVILHRTTGENFP